MEIIGYIIIGLVASIMGACAVTPIILDSMSKEEREAAGIVWKEND
jgi:predicted cobalt transporter CbtA